ncbi:MAG: hypothetical protein BGO01_17755 [Armatimonadetes bacterium 55-13]|nr:DUF1385 domain-containing protein [Armatimonadota bacterium]OJU63987.1 MAG: hypothetical protein BGO01_17755 [Armatimonadetes bacterium 55-13]
MPLAPLSRPVATSMRATFSVPVENSLSTAAQRMRENGAEVLAVIEGQMLRGVVTERSLARAIGEGAEETDSVQVAFDPLEPFVYQYQTGAEALRRFEEFGVGALIVVDDDRRVVGLLRASDLVSPPVVQNRPANIGGMATPFGVYLTSGTVKAGSQGLALVTTGMTLFTVLTSASILAGFLDEFLIRHHVSTSVTDFLVGIAQYALFGIGFRLLPISGIHAAEHMVVHAIERGEPLVPSVVKRMPRVHPRCGTNLATAVTLYLGIAMFPTTQWLGDDPGIESLKLLVALVVTVIFWRPLGGLVQYWITTRPPSDKQIQMGIKSGKELLDRQSHAHRIRIGFFGRLWNSGLFHVMAGSIICFTILSLLSYLFHWDLPL